MRELVYYVSVSLDGYIAGPQHQFDSFLVAGDHAEVLQEEFADAIPTDFAGQLGIPQTGERFGAVVMGANTHAVGLPQMPSPYRHLEQVVFTHRELPAGENLTVTDADPVRTVREMKRQEGADIWLCGGGMLATQLRDEIDRLVLKRQPLLLGDGIPLFAPGDYAPQQWDLVRCLGFDSGVSLTELTPRR